MVALAEQPACTGIFEGAETLPLPQDKQAVSEYVEKLTNMVDNMDPTFLGPEGVNLDKLPPMNVRFG